jgi:UDP-glucose 4-epimerase
MENMTVLVTGGAGYIGSHTVHELADAGERLVVIDNLSTGRANAVGNRAELITGDIGDLECVTSALAKHSVEAIIHFAGSIIVPESVADPLGYYKNNTANSRLLIELAVRYGVRHFIFSSTAAVYGNPIAVPVREDAPPAPISPYGWSKLMTEIMLRDATAAYGLSHVALRYFNVAGADRLMRTGQATPNATHLIKVAVETALGLREGIEVFGNDYATPDGTCIRDYIHVSDLARAHGAALNYLRRGGKSATVNCGYGRGYSVFEVLDAVARSAGHSLPVHLAPRRQGDPVSIVADTRLIRELFDWNPERDSLDTIVADALAWERLLQENQKMA